MLSLLTIFHSQPEEGMAKIGEDRTLQTSSVLSRSIPKHPITLCCYCGGSGGVEVGKFVNMNTARAASRLPVNSEAWHRIRI